MSKVINYIKKNQTICASGCFDTILAQNYGELIDSIPRVALDNLNILEEIASIYFEAGADLVTTFTCESSPLQLTPHSLDDRATRINKNAVRSARDAVGTQAYIAGLCGPSGRVLKPYGSTTIKELTSNYHVQISALLEEGVDCILLYRLDDVIEASLATVTAKKIDAGIPVIATLKMLPSPSGYCTVTGTGIETAVKSLEDAGADFLGASCGNRIEGIIKIIREMKQYTTLPLAAFPDVGDSDKYSTEVHPELDDTPEYLASRIPELMDLGVSIIGGCCRTSPEHILAISKEILTYYDSK